MIVLTLIYFGLISISLGSYLSSSEEDDFMSPSVRIAGGISLQKQEDMVDFSYQVGIYIIKSDGMTTLCGGALIHPKIILTAGHCVDKAIEASVFMGTYVKPRSQYDSNNIIIEQPNFILHEDYNDKTFEDDIGMIILPEAVKLSRYIGIVRLASYNWTNCDQGVAWVSGWGVTDNGNSSPKELQYLKVEPISHEECYTFYNFITKKKQLCSSGDLYEGICPGDSGGPYTFEDFFGHRYLCGLNSFAALSGCVNNLPKGYVSVAYYHDIGWICEKSGGLVGCH